jgi:coiled-coil domain-containing protein 130
MSSLAATQADGYYLPPEYFESGAYLKLTKNQWHAAGSASQSSGHCAKQQQSPPVVRFELPCSGVCMGCNSYIGKGTRFNAVKVKTSDKYLSSSIFEFRLKCRSCCIQEFVIRTNPQAKCFDFLQGIKRAQGGGGGGGGGGGHTLQRPQENKVTSGSNTYDSDEHEKEVLDRLETIARGQRKAISEIDQLRSLQKSKERCFLQDSDMNAAVRATFRVERQDRKRKRRAAEALGYREGISLMDPMVEDTLDARLTTFGDCRERERKKLREARTSSIFAGTRKRRTRSTRKTHGMSTTHQAIPDGITSSSSVAQQTASKLSKNQNTASKVQVHQNICHIGKKTVVVAHQKACLLVAMSSDGPTDSAKQYGSALDALADYGSDCS